MKYKKQVKKASKLVRKAKRQFERRIADIIKSDSKSFYTYVRCKSRAKPTVGPLTDIKDGTLVSNDKM